MHEARPAAPLNTLETVRIARAGLWRLTRTSFTDKEKRMKTRRRCCSLYEHHVPVSLNITDTEQAVLLGALIPDCRLSLLDWAKKSE